MATESRVRISLQRQALELVCNADVLARFAVSTSLYGAGETKGSERTPRGRHIIRAKIGAGVPVGTVFRGRRPTGQVYSAALARAEPGRDWILTRILWLSGVELGRNRLGNVDSMQRYIYIHGTPDTEPVGVPKSHGCIRMRNADVVWLFDRVSAGTLVEIE